MLTVCVEFVWILTVCVEYVCMQRLFGRLSDCVCVGPDGVYATQPEVIKGVCVCVCVCVCVYGVNVSF